MEESANSNYSLVECSQQVLELWKAFDIEAKKATLDKACIDMREFKTNSINGRKRLNDVTRAFRAKSANEQIITLNDLLKAYQEEIDQLAKRSKFSESSFFSIYKSLSDIPDPSECIDELLRTLTSGSTQQLEIERLKAELRQYDEEFQQLKNQDITIRRLEDQLQEFKDQNEQKVAEEVQRRVLEVERQTESRINDFKQVQRNFEKRVNSAVESMKQAQMSADRAQSQLFEASTQAEYRISALLSENSILAENVQRVTLKLHETENELASMKDSFASKQREKDGKSDGAGKTDGATEDTLTLQLVIAELRDELRRSEDQSRTDKQRLDARVRELLQEQTADRDALSRLQEELKGRPTRDEHSSVRRQLRVVQKIAFNVDDADDDESALESSDPEHTNGQKVAQLEELLSARLRAIDSELTDVKQRLVDAQTKEAAAHSTIASLRKSLETSAQLISRLEADVELQYKLRASGSEGTNDVDLAALLGVSDDRPATAAANTGGVQSTKAGTNAQKSDPNTQMVAVLQSQRDRYKDRLAAAEATIMRMQQSVDATQLRAEQLQADNLALYGKIRFLQSYSGNDKNYVSPRPMKISNKQSAPIGSSSGGLSKRLYADEEAAADDDSGDERTVERRYHALYEQKMNPFAEFSQHERRRKLQELSVADRIVLNTTLAIVSNHTGRSVLMVYLGLMHLLVFVTIYYSAHSVHYGCDPAADHLASHQQRIDLHHQQQQQQLAPVLQEAAQQVVGVVRRLLRSDHA